MDFKDYETIISVMAEKIRTLNTLNDYFYKENERLKAENAELAQPRVVNFGE